jgi:hypothetical protein
LKWSHISWIYFSWGGVGYAPRQMLFHLVTSEVRGLRSMALGNPLLLDIHYRPYFPLGLLQASVKCHTKHSTKLEIFSFAYNFIGTKPTARWQWCEVHKTCAQGPEAQSCTKPVAVQTLVLWQSRGVGIVLITTFPWRTKALDFSYKLDVYRCDSHPVYDECCSAQWNKVRKLLGVINNIQRDGRGYRRR